jgi:diguanylate cyclase (GGDEF)-like protein
MAARIQANEKELRALAMTDPLTAVLNRRGFMQRAEVEAAHCRRHGRPLAVLALDIDHFKAVNDTHGHDGCDAG